MRRRWLWYCGFAWVQLGATLAFAVALSGCATRRAAQLVIDHHVGMVRGGWDVLSGKAEEREQRTAKLQADIEQSRTALGAETDPSRQLEFLKEHVGLQEALIAELLQQKHCHHEGAHQQARTDSQREGHASARTTTSGIGHFAV